jgi:type II secretory pathway pseudopilin PulG
MRIPGGPGASPIGPERGVSSPRRDGRPHPAGTIEDGPACKSSFGKKAVTESCKGFTLAEVLAALMFMAILIPVAIHGIQVASRAGESAVRRGEAALVADSILNQLIVTTNWNQAVQTGVVKQGLREFHWTLKNEPWSKDPNATTMRQLTIEVNYPVQGTEHSVKLSTLMDGSPPTTQSSFQQ